ncbi:MAG TPA: hypothetical protein VJ248_09780 [Candidatus Udaeobacter sp.]|nr:hypothetical protein [Candidatus Udaeobacter sp.]
MSERPENGMIRFTIDWGDEKKYFEWNHGIGKFVITTSGDLSFQKMTTDQFFDDKEAIDQLFDKTRQVFLESKGVTP